MIPKAPYYQLENQEIQNTKTKETIYKNHQMCHFGIWYGRVRSIEFMIFKIVNFKKDRALHLGFPPKCTRFMKESLSKKFTDL